MSDKNMSYSLSCNQIRRTTELVIFYDRLLINPREYDRKFCKHYILTLKTKKNKIILQDYFTTEIKANIHHEDYSNIQKSTYYPAG